MHTNAATYKTFPYTTLFRSNYNNIANTTITDTINKATATVVVTPYTVTYDGHAHTAAITSITGVNGKSEEHTSELQSQTNIETNPVPDKTDFWSFTGAANYN